MGVCLGGGSSGAWSPFQNNPQNLDPFYKIDLDFQNCFTQYKGKIHLMAYRNNFKYWDG